MKVIVSEAAQEDMSYRCYLGRRFHFAALYQIKEHKVIVKAVSDTRRDPSWITRRMGQ